MEELFLQVLNMSLTASVAIVAVVLLRFVLKKMPKSVSYSLWAVVLFRLVCPFSFESVISLIPSARPLPQEILTSPNPMIDSGFPVIDQSVTLPAPMPGASVNPMQVLLYAGALIWIAGTALMLAYSVISYVMLKRRISLALLIEKNIYECEAISSPFVLGALKPKIYLPLHISAAEREYILEHERTHIRRFDTLIKPLAFLVLSLHWFNPLVWLSFVLMTKDMELSCDEAVLKTMGGEIKRDYSASLLSLARGRKMLSGSPLAFGESNVKTRIKNVLSYKRPAFWVIAVAAVMAAALGLGLLANPKLEFNLEDTIAMGRDFSSAESEPIAVGKAAFEHYYAAFMGDEIPAEYRISEYKLTELSLRAGDEAEFCVEGHSALKTDGDYFLVGNGTPYEDRAGGECPDLFMQMRIKNLGEGKYRIIDMGTGGCESGLQPVDAADISPEDFVGAINSSVKVEGGNIELTVPAGLPTGYSARQIYIHVSGTLPMGDDNMSLHAFEKESEGYLWEAGKKYSENIFDSKDVPDGTELYVSAGLLQDEKDGNSTILYEKTIEKIYPLRDDSTEPSANIEDGSVTFTDKFGDSLKLMLKLPEGWSMRVSTAENQAAVAPEVDIYNGNAMVGSISCKDFDLYRDKNDQIPYMSVYSGIMLGSVASWDNEYTEIAKTRTASTATCRPWHKEYIEGKSNVEMPEIYNKGILSYDAELLKYVAIFLDEGGVSEEHWMNIAKSVRLSDGGGL